MNRPRLIAAMVRTQGQMSREDLELLGKAGTGEKLKLLSTNPFLKALHSQLQTEFSVFAMMRTKDLLAIYTQLPNYKAAFDKILDGYRTANSQRIRTDAPQRPVCPQCRGSKGYARGQFHACGPCNGTGLQRFSDEQEILFELQLVAWEAATGKSCPRT
jgi:hypothetical protein